MLNRMEGRNIAGQKLIDEYGREYLISVKERLGFAESFEKNVLTVHFCIYAEDVLDVDVEKNGGIFVNETNFPEPLIDVSVDLRTGEAKIVKE